MSAANGTGRQRAAWTRRILGAVLAALSIAGFLASSIQAQQSHAKRTSSHRHGVIKARAVAPLTTGVVQDQWPEAPWWNGAIRALGGTFVRFEVPWTQIEPTRPAPGSNPGNPANAAYEWQNYIDSEITAASNAGLHVILVIDQAPRWAEGGGMPAGTTPGTWRPDPSAYAGFARAIATRYSGAYPSPQHPGTNLPAVRDWEAWNEPNEPSELNPQWVRVGGGFAPASPDVYRPLLNAFYSQVKAVSPSNRVISAGLAPFGDQPGGRRMMPMTFLRGLLCLDHSLRSSCGNVAAFDAQDMHPYSPKSPHWHALNADDVTVPDIYKVDRAEAAARNLHHTAPAGPKQVIVTEFSWDTNPPDPHGISLQTQARWLADGLYTLWSQGVSTVLWWRLTDQDPGSRGYPFTYQSGLFFENGGRKPSATAFGFPFVVHRTSRSKVFAWGKLPMAGRVAIQRLSHHRWRTLRTLSVGGNDVFLTRFTMRGAANMRAVEGSRKTLNWSVR